MPQVPERKQGLLRIIKATQYSWQGIKTTWKHEAAFRQESLLFFVMLIAAVIVDFSGLERALLIFSAGLVLIVELLNSAVEACINRIGPEYHKLSGAAKDIGSAAVFVSLCLTAIVWCLILWDKFQT